MRQPKEKTARAAIAGLFGLTDAELENMIILLDTPSGTALFHTVCCHEHAKAILAECANSTGVDMQAGSVN